MSSFPSPGTPSGGNTDSLVKVDRDDPPVAPIPEPALDSGEMIFDDLMADLAKPVDAPELLYSLPHRQGWHMRYRQIADYAEIERATKAGDRTRKRASVRPGEVDIDGLRVSSILLATHNTGILRGGHLWMQDGIPVTVRSKAFLETMTKAAKAQGNGVGQLSTGGALIMAYGWDADVLNHGNRLQQDSGWANGAGNDDEDPTPAE